MFRTAQNRSEQVISVGWQVIEESCRVENFHDASEHARCSSKPGARHHAVELASSRAAPPGETFPLSRNPDPRSYHDRSVVGTGSGRIAVYPKIIPGQKSASRRSFIDLPEPRFGSRSGSAAPEVVAGSITFDWPTIRPQSSDRPRTE
jgi:hypothetical protein